jgi:peptide deformylase
LLQLRKDNEPITEFDDTLKRLAEEMLLLMYAADGVGLAAPQVGINKRLMVFNEDGDPMSKGKEMVLVNPVITAKSNKSVTAEEGCLSFPNIYGDVRRAQWIAVDYQQLDGATVKNKYFEGNNAIIFQHEYDHLDKILFIDRIDETQREQNSRKLDKLIRKYGPGGIL